VVETYDVLLLIPKDLREQLPPKCEGWVSVGDLRKDFSKYFQPFFLPLQVIVKKRLRRSTTMCCKSDFSVTRPHPSFSVPPGGLFSQPSARNRYTVLSRTLAFLKIVAKCERWGSAAVPGGRTGTEAGATDTAGWKPALQLCARGMVSWRRRALLDKPAVAQ
jgi:hypothetical protein